MTTTTSDNIPKESEKETETESNSRQEKKDADWLTRAADLVNRVPVPRLLLSLSLIAYGVVAFSKKEDGVKAMDLLYLIGYVFFTILVFIILIVLRDIYRYKQKEITTFVCGSIFKK